jgi:hypothetical protein
MPLLIKYPSVSLTASWTLSKLIICKSNKPFKNNPYITKTTVHKVFCPLSSLEKSETGFYNKA